MEVRRAGDPAHVQSPLQEPPVGYKAWMVSFSAAARQTNLYIKNSFGSAHEVVRVSTQPKVGTCCAIAVPRNSLQAR